MTGRTIRLNISSRTNSSAAPLNAASEKSTIREASREKERLLARGNTAQERSRRAVGGPMTFTPPVPGSKLLPCNPTPCLPGGQPEPPVHQPCRHADRARRLLFLED